MTKNKDSLDAKFDVVNWSSTIFSTIDEHRSDASASGFIDSSADAASGTRVESRLNCFYRLVGLPATRAMEARRATDNLPKEDPLKTEPWSLTDLSQQDTLNYFDSEDLFFSSADSLKKISLREAALAKKKTNEDFRLLLNEPLDISELSSRNSKPRHTSIFPMVVDASIPVYPLSRRMAPLFYNGNKMLPGNKPKRMLRPFIESVIYIRTYRFQEDVEAEAQNTQGELISLLDDIKLSDEASSTALFNFKTNLSADFTRLEAEVISNLVQLIRKSSHNYKKIYDSSKRLSQEIAFYPRPVENPDENSGNEIPGELIALASFADNEEKLLPKVADERVAQLNKRLSEVLSFAKALPTEIVLESTKTYSIINSWDASNISPDIFVSEFADLMTNERVTLQEQLEEAKAKQAQKLKEYELVKQSIMYFTGEGAGLSIFDILCTFLALFTVDIETLIALLNNSAQKRLLNNKFFSFPENWVATGGKGAIFKDQSSTVFLSDAVKNSSKSTREALLEFEANVQDNFSLAKAFFAEASAAGNKQGR